MNAKLERVWMDGILAHLKILSRHSPGGTEESEGFQSKTQCRGRDSNSASPERKREASPPKRTLLSLRLYILLNKKWYNLLQQQIFLNVLIYTVFKPKLGDIFPAFSFNLYGLQCSTVLLAIDMNYNAVLLEFNHFSGL
jgi:hypothetical protein